jgi:hypothetical protein
LELAEEEEKGRQAPWQSPYRLRHLNSGRCLTTIKMIKDKSEYFIMVLAKEQNMTESDFMEATKFYLESTTFDTDETIRLNSVVKIKHLFKDT